MTFWLITMALALGSCALLALALWRGHLGARPAAEFDLRVYRDQLSEVERDIERGVIKGDDAERVLTEISRRILTADKALQDESVDVRSPKATRFVAIGALAAVLIGGSFALYRDLGAPGYGDLALSTRIEAAADARASRPDQATAEASLPPFVIAPDTPETYAE
jgi:cytochrome c-type biogenesis protein CcmH